ncbi:hypothetical protein AFIC_002089 [[Pseudomonas] carboxydohydrogena]|uniref:Uncharacterized protein n=1 Tax=Afipia carboxydohydrogena TaxID=290 RepID=A0ABY8BKK9_AFICR|nr:hypothetical protein AFIC_002089 [[Pseudomonas] carboxydohydrogena]
MSRSTALRTPLARLRFGPVPDLSGAFFSAGAFFVVTFFAGALFGVFFAAPAFLTATRFAAAGRLTGTVVFLVGINRLPSSPTKM